VVVQALGGLPEARPGKLVRVAYAADARATSIDLRDFMAVGGESIDVNVQAAAANRAALDGEAVRARQAAATCALLVHAATGEEPHAAAERALAALTSGRARQVLAKLQG
jgi:anthranilate phosphoribosyltransferase